MHYVEFVDLLTAEANAFEEFWTDGRLREDAGEDVCFPEAANLSTWIEQFMFFLESKYSTINKD